MLFSNVLFNNTLKLPVYENPCIAGVLHYYVKI